MSAARCFRRRASRIDRSGGAPGLARKRRRQLSWFIASGVEHFPPSRVHSLTDRRSAGVWRDTMVWKTPKIVEIVCGAEINAYVSAEIA